MPAGDPAAIERLGQFGGPTLVQRMVAVFLDDAPRRVATLRGALARGDLTDVHAVAHSLKSSCAQLGALTMHALSVQIERSEDGHAIAEWLEQLSAEFARYRAWVATIAPRDGP